MGNTKNKVVARNTYIIAVRWTGQNIWTIQGTGRNVKKLKASLQQTLESSSVLAESIRWFKFDGKVGDIVSTSEPK